jgi:predicted transcriptional regulator of viral defense system
MEFSRLLDVVQDDPLFETGLLLAGNEDPVDVRRQLSRWTEAGRLHQLRRGLYALAPPFQKRKPHPFLVANRLARGSYVSCQSALGHYGMIPEVVTVTTSVTTGRPARRETPLGVFQFRHVRSSWLRGYKALALDDQQEAFVATPEKALLDLVYLEPGADAPAYLAELRLQNLDRLDLEELDRHVNLGQKPKLWRAAALVKELVRAEARNLETL